MWSACERWLSTSEQCFTVLHQNDNQTSGVCCLDLLGCIAFVALALLCVQCITLIMTIIIIVIMMDWICMELFKAPKTLYTLNPLFIHVTFALVVVSYIHHCAPGAD